MTKQESGADVEMASVLIKLWALLLILLSWSQVAQAQVNGTLVHYQTGQVEILTASGPLVLQASGEAYKGIVSRGLGSRWEIWTTAPDQVERGNFQGRDGQLAAGLDQALLFVQRLNNRNFKAAYEMVSARQTQLQKFPEFSAYWETHYLSTDLQDWKLKDMSTDHLTLQVSGSMSSARRSFKSSPYRPKQSTSRLKIIHASGKWAVDGW